jgi:hypothetical protein
MVAGPKHGRPVISDDLPFDHEHSCTTEGLANE